MLCETVHSEKSEPPLNVHCTTVDCSVYNKVD